MVAWCCAWLGRELKMVKIKTININKVKVDKDLYPRVAFQYPTLYRYSAQMRSGASFPPIVVAVKKGKYILVDGLHRLEATKLNKQKTIRAEVLSGLTDVQIFAEAVRRNVKHGSPLGTSETIKCIQKLKAMGLNGVSVAGIVNLSLKDMDKFVARHTVTSTSISGKTIVLKKAVSHLKQTPEKVDDIDETKIDDLKIGGGQITTIDELINLIENKLINLQDGYVVDRLKHLKKLLNKLHI